MNSYMCLAKLAPGQELKSLAIDMVCEWRLWFGYAPRYQFLDKPVTVGGPQSGFSCKDAHAVRNCICK